MSEDDQVTLEARLERLERQVAEISAALGMRDAASRPRGWRPNRASTQPRAAYQSPLASKSIEWWLARGGAILTCLALVLLYQYAVERNWITPVVRVAAGILVGIALFYGASRTARAVDPVSDDTIGLREVLLGAGLAAWYITAYAAAVYYSLIPVGAARLLFFILSAAGAWLALSEQRSVLGFLAIATGFLTPLFLPSPDPFIPVAAAYLAALTAVGIIVYLMRGWQSMLWLTFAGFWWTASEVVDLMCCFNARAPRVTGSVASARTAMSIVTIAAGAALVRTSLLRRRLVATGSSLYTTPRKSARGSHAAERLARNFEQISGVPAQTDSLALWLITILSPLLAVLFLSRLWAAVEGTAWGLLSLALAAVAYRLSTRSESDEEFTHVEVTAAAAWSLAGITWVADAIGSRWSISSELVMSSAAIHAVLTLRYFLKTRFSAPLKIAVATASICVASVLLSETMLRNFAIRGFDAGWTIAELVVVASALWIWWTLRSPAEVWSTGTLFGLSAYLSLMFIDSRILNQIWPPLITASFAAAGAALLMLGRGRAEARTLRRLGGFTLVVVVARLFMFDLARVETIWRVILFLGCGALFLFTSHRLQERTGSTETAP